jgi:hypothetical protein
MGLDATVYCDCFERGRHRTPPHPEWCVYVDESGARFAKTADLEQDWAFEKWNVDACEHEGGVLLHHWLGNISAIGLIRETLSQTALQYPIVLSKVIYSGSHGGDYLPFPLVSELQSEVDLLAELHPQNPVAAEWIQDFEQKLRELIDAATQVRKPISF